MSSSNPASPEEAVDEAVLDPEPEPETPLKPSTQDENDGKETPKSAPPVAHRGRPRAKSTREPTLLHDFLLGRPSASRQAAERQRRMSLEAVKAELRHEMKQSQVKRIQPPNGVRDRVKKWQKANAAAMENTPDDAATEPPDIAFEDEDFQSVTEEDRVRIKMRKKLKRPNNKTKESLATGDEATPDETPTTPAPVAAKPPPKKRVVSDEHWRKNRKHIPKKTSPAKTPAPAKIPKDFVLRTAANPRVASRVKAWAEMVEIPDPPAPRSHKSSKSVGAKPWMDDTDSEFMSDSEFTVSNVTSSRFTKARSAKSTPGPDDGIRVKPIRRGRNNDDGIRVKAVRTTLTDDEGIRVRPMSDISSNAGTSVRTARLRLKSAPSSRRPSMSSVKREMKKSQSDKSKIGVIEDPSEVSTNKFIEVIEDDSELSKTTKTTDKSGLSGIAPIEVMEDDSAIDTPTKKRSTSAHKSKPRPKSYQPPTTKQKGKETWVPEEESTIEPSQLDGSDLSSSILAKSIADIPGEIPWGNSAFTELDLPLRARGGPLRSRPIRPARPAKPERNTSFKSMPKVFKKVVEGANKIIHEMNEHPPPRDTVPNNPRSIEKWLNTTVDPFVEEPKAEPATTPLSEHIPDKPSSPETIKSHRRSSRTENRRVSSSTMSKPDTADRTVSSEKLPVTPEPVKEPVKERPTPSPVPKTGPVKEPAKEPSPEPESPKKSTSKPKPEPKSEPQPEPAAVKEPAPEEVSPLSLPALSPEPEAKTKPKRQDTKAPTKAPGGLGLKRTKATRTTSSPVKSSPKNSLFGMLKEAFTGESGNSLPKVKPYQSREERPYDDEPESMYTDSRYSDSRYDDSKYEGPKYDDYHYEESRYDDELTYDDSTENWTETELSKAEKSRSVRSPSPLEEKKKAQIPEQPREPIREPAREPEQNRDDRSALPSARMAGPRLPPPTRGQYELSTILSEEASSAVESDLTTDVTQSTLTQSTGVTKETRRSNSRSNSKSQGSGLKRRLTRHSDLVSVLSLPDDKNVPSAITSNRSRPSMRKSRGGATDVTNDDLLKEFTEDESLYLRELKTLVDGVIPVLLSQVVNGDNATDLFGTSTPVTKADALSKSVVNMGVALEKLRMAHRKAPIHDIRRLASWGHGVVPIYHKYLDAWRLGFQDLVVNLAPAAGSPEDEDSLVGAMPRNESGDIVDATGERVDVAHLLKRPLLRLKQITKFFKCVDSILGTNDTYDLLSDFEDLQEKARRRHREEMARLTDEDAINTDTTRSRDLRTLAPMEAVYIEPSRQVSAKDFFSLDLAHSNGQRLECQIELVHRDNQRYPEDKGDILIRENGVKGRSYLLFPPVPIELISARTGDGNFDMVVMIRGTHNDRPWHELLTLTTDNEDQILDWLDILPVSPVPPREPEPSIIDDEEPYSQSRMPDVPVGVRGSSRKYSAQSLRNSHSRRSSAAESPPASPTTPKRALPARYRPRSASPVTPPPLKSPDQYDLQRTPTQYDYGYEDRPMTSQSMQPDPLNIRKSPSSSSYRDDGAPPPPAHRTFSPSPSQQAPSKPRFSKAPPLEPPNSSRVKRRTSSPLKHEYLPSDQSSISGTDITGSYENTEDDYTESDYSYDSSDDDIESVDLPETELGVSIRDEHPARDIIREELEHQLETLEEEGSLHDYHQRHELHESVVSGSIDSLAPSNSASQAGLHGQKVAPEDNATRYVATISRWSDKGLWKDISGGNLEVIVTPGLIEAYAVHSGAEQGDKPMLALDLTPLVLIRQSTALDLEIRSSVRSDCQLASSHGGGNFRFRCHNGPDCYNLYMSVHHARLNNQKFIELENEARFRSFGEHKPPPDNDDTSSRRRSWFGRKNSYRGSVRAPAQSHDGASTTPSSTLSASSFLKRLTGRGLPFSLARSSVNRNSRYGGTNTPGSSSYGGNTPRSPSISVENSGRGPASFGTEDLKIRLHLLVAAAKWEDFGNCRLSIRRPPPGWHQALRADHGLEKRVTVTTIPRKDSEQPKILLDAVLGSGCFTAMGSRGIVCGVWEEMKDSNGVVGVVPATGPTGGNVKKWCFQCASVAEASWVLRLVHQEVMTI
ncbi:hypothetical protein FVEG_07412 [Fusarium verticillioides 7600]|uniref:Uncharacterized protein n=1 Tax=Gibberella moniliformis (strain M3125 / FGSC 7600) TaxID=334819 RepID=W7M6P5_GIBM7|nr:hypothetical protein FVEG_07412 [Fusarium verticillioides 7600]EWG47253.1 hypothetical protein FVEG_07412 [Fusarium verticillioides 7600]RBQ88799.1 hypothetical protein FVER53263_07412 [Fusarium verticillioides]